MRRIELGGSWKLIREMDGSSRDMTVPGDIMSALITAGEIPDPYAGRNELELQWIGREDWRIETSVELTAADLASERICLEAEVIDTVAEVRVNGSLLAASENMFRRLRAEAKPLLKVGSNRISVTIRSPEKAAAEAASRLPYPVPASEYPVTSPHRNLLRKAQCMAGWDWGPCLMTGGIYDGIALIAYDGPRIDYVTTRMRKVPDPRTDRNGVRDQGDWLVSVEVELEAAKDEAIRLDASLAGARGGLSARVPAGSSKLSFELRVASPELWSPAGYGAQRLYELEVTCSQEKAAPGQGFKLSKRLGFRELEVRAVEDEWGKSLTFAVNGRAVFAKGANWIPADALPSRCTRERLASLLGAAAAAHMNCLRVWGGGRYESDAFYELCDELGILVWQDCMFSCALYPATPEFLAEVEKELVHQVKRLKDHPCLALWCGNNEALGAITWYEESRKNPAHYVVDYDRLTEGTVGRVVRELDPDRQWWPSSPSAGPNDYSDNWHTDGRGDMHFWSVWHEGKPFSAYLDVKPRFCSEFGYQSFPSSRMVSSFAGKDERNVTSPSFEHHQRHPRGNSIIVENMLRYFRMPSGFEATLYLSQVQQALAIRTAVEYWRSLKPRCMGSLYWQLNDVWPVASWSSLDYDGGWKLLHYEARRFYEPLHLALIVKDGAVEAHVISDLPEAFHAGLSLAFRRFDGSLVSEANVEGEVGADAAVKLWSLSLAELPLKPEEVFMEGKLTARPAAPAGNRQPAQIRHATAFLTEPKRCALPDSGLSARVEASAAGLSVRVRAERPSFWLALDLDPESAIKGRFEDSGFDLGAGEEVSVRFLPEEGKKSPSPEELSAVLRLMDLASSSKG